MLTWALARRLAGTSVTANALHPGAVNTALLRALAPGFSGITPAEGADTAIWLATSPELAGVSGKLWVRRRETTCEFRARNSEEALWSLCDQMIVG
jgi:NAD(P)-dependent dehydrogenase (short-subunit alcohol dehydrogenase family)